LQGFQSDYLASVYKNTAADLLSVAYLENDRVAVFLFDSGQPTQFIVVTESLVDSSRAPLTAEKVGVTLKKAFGTLMARYEKNEFQALPGIASNQNQTKESPTAEAERKSERARSLFKQLSAIADGPVYMGAGIGMSRFDRGASVGSVPNVTLFLGLKPSEFFRWELGAHVFSFALGFTDLKYQVPIFEKYMSFFLGGSIAYMLAPVTTNRGPRKDPLPVGLYFGPVVTFDIPLLGANIRGELKYLLGPSSSHVLLATYGLSFSL
jgi:hypothetical protein